MDDVEDKIPIVVHIGVVFECVVCTTRSRDPSGGGINHLLAPHQHHHQEVFVIINTTCMGISLFTRTPSRRSLVGYAPWTEYQLKQHNDLKMSNWDAKIQLGIKPQYFHYLLTKSEDCAWGRVGKNGLDWGCAEVGKRAKMVQKATEKNAYLVVIEQTSLNPKTAQDARDLTFRGLSVQSWVM